MENIISTVRYLTILQQFEVIENLNIVNKIGSSAMMAPQMTIFSSVKVHIPTV